MAVEITKTFELPSRGKLYQKEVKWQNALRAPKLCDRGFGEITKKNKLQSTILDKTIVEPMGISTYDLHPADFTYLNFIQRQVLRGNAPYKISVACKNCDTQHKIDIDVDSIKVTPLTKFEISTIKTASEDEVTVSYATPRILDSVDDAVELFKEDYPEADGDLPTQEYLRKVITHVNGVKLTHSQMTHFIQNLYLSDAESIMGASLNWDWGLQLQRKQRCDKCGKMLIYIIPV